MLPKHLYKIIEQLYGIPNAPFSVTHRSKYIVDYLQKARLQPEETPYYIKVSLSGNSNKRKVIIMTHLDHPGFVFENSKKGKAFGSLYLHKVTKLKPISVFSPTGEYLGDVNITRIYGRDESKIEVASTFKIPKNSQGIWNVGAPSFDKNKLYGRSHDNDILTSLILSNLQKVSTSEYEIIIIFNKHEEILQLSAYNIAKNNSLGISQDDIIINLESMKVYPISKPSKLNYTDGPVLNISEATGIYSRTGTNQAESLVNNIADKLGLALQRGLAGGTSDARPMSAHNLTNNIVTINIPNKYKHNSDGNSIRSEEIFIKDIITVDRILKEIISGSSTTTVENINDISKSAISSYDDFSKQISNNYLSLNERLDTSYYPIIQRGYYFPITSMDYINDIYYRIKSYVEYFLKKGSLRQKVSKI